MRYANENTCGNAMLLGMPFSTMISSSPTLKTKDLYCTTGIVMPTATQLVGGSETLTSLVLASATRLQ